MEILRIENYNKNGVYNIHYLSPPYAYGLYHPRPFEDPLLKDSYKNLLDCEKWYFGFKDKDQLVRWFPEEYWTNFYEFNSSNETPIGISTYEVLSNDVLVGESQVMFILDRSERLKFEPFLR